VFRKAYPSLAHHIHVMGMPFLSNSVLLKVGSLGYFLGFVSWVVWAVAAFVSFAVITGPDHLPMSGIFFQSSSLAMVFYALLSFSFLLCAVGCFAFSNRQGSGLALASGAVFVVAFASIAVPRLVRGWPFFFFNFPFLMFLGLILWGATLLTTAGKLASRWQGKIAGVLFVVAGTFGLLVWEAILYWGLELWLLMAGWLYAAGAFTTVLILYRMSSA
jgi:hypothetical protein